MRRVPRLQVSTFPFLAVLLCAMGALILLLLVMDRRAKVVARHKAEQEAHASAAAQVQLVEARKQEWQRQRLALHELLAHDHEHLRQQVHELYEQMTAAEHNLREEKSRLHACEQNLAGAKERLAAEQAMLRAREAKPPRESHPKAELESLAGQLAELEQTLLALKALRQREQHTYSVVPYGGRRGASRKPLYIECSADGVIVHPDRLVLTGPRFHGAALRQEVQERLGRLQPASARREDERPYVLMLVRPAGIQSYAEAQAALQGLKLDFGYELIDADWVLDFAADGLPQPWRAAHGGGLAEPLPTDDSEPPPSSAGEPRGPPAATSRGALDRVVVGRGASAAGSNTAGEGSASGANVGWTLVAPPKVGGVTGEGRGGVPFSAMAATGPGPGAAAASPSAPQPAPRPAPRPTSLADGRASLGSPENTVPSSVLLTPPMAPAPDERALAGPARSSMRPSNDSQTARTPPSPLSRLLGSRDLVIVIECRSDCVVVHPGGRLFATDALATRGDDGDTLAESVRQIIARRQAAVRAGEPPYRPLLRFQIRPEGLRSYYRAFPLLESLRLPMTRENID